MAHTPPTKATIEPTDKSMCVAMMTKTMRGLATVIVGESVPITSPEFRGIARNYLPQLLGWWGPFDGIPCARRV